MTERDSREAAFKKAYASLNKAQKEAVDTTEGPVMVIAGPGTGKTQILTLRIANILFTTDTAPENILALTFTESGARAMRERLRSFIGAPAYRVPIYTFHGFAGELINAYPDSYPAIIGGRPATALEKVALVESILEDTSFKLLRPLGNPTYYVSAILREIANLKKEYLEPDALAEIVAQQEESLAAMPKVHEKGAHKGKVRGEYHKKEKSVGKNKELLAIYRRYQALLSEANLYDFEDMMLQTVHALENNEDMLRDLQETHHYLLADEHQDVNASQNRILELLASYHARPNIFVVGDEKQAIYRFQGASLENFLYFEDTFAHTKTISLTQNYRSGQAILDAAHELVAVESEPLSLLRVPLQAVKKKNGTLDYREFLHSTNEYNWIVNEVSTLIDGGTPADDIAIIVRTNAEVEQLASALRGAGLIVSASADSDILSHRVMQEIRSLMTATVYPENEAALFRVLHSPYWGIPVGDVVKVLKARSYSTSLASLVSNEEEIGELQLQSPEAVLRIGSVLHEARIMETVVSPQRILEYLVTHSGLLESSLLQHPAAVTHTVRRLYDEVESLVVAKTARTLMDVVLLLDQYEAHSLPLNAPSLERDANAVQVMTAHKAKGLEFAHVFVPGLSDTMWGGKRGRTAFDIPYTRQVQESDLPKSEDDRRLLYVALTRAETLLHLSSSSSNETGRAFVPSRFLEDIPKLLLPEFKTDTESPPAVKANTAIPKIDSAWIEEIFLERGFSATSLNNYLRSPWDYFYRNVLRIPEVQALHLQYGTALHGVMQNVTRDYSSSKKQPSTSAVAKLLERELGRFALSAEEFARLHEQGLSALCVYLEDVVGTLPTVTKEEFSIRVSLPTGLSDLPQIPLSGNLDRLDFDEAGKVTQVVDYKTGKPKTRGYIEGSTKDSDGDYKRQLVFYALLLSLLEEKRYACQQGVLSFLEPDSKGRIHHEVFSITDDEIAELTKTIIDSAVSITNGSFLKEPCDENKSSYCNLVEQLRITLS